MKQYDKLEKKEVKNSNYIGKNIAIKPTQGKPLNYRRPLHK
jgi:hypothetical protein